VAAVVANIVPYFLFGWGEQRTSSALAGVLNATTPLFTLSG
jgi:drug/metabolite transporter (DMT)-like permease